MATSNKTLDGQVVLITGAASGIGAATALEVLAHGGVPVLVDCDAEPLAQMAQRCGPQTLHWVADVTQLQALQVVVEKTLAELGRIDIVFANAGVAAFGPMAYIDPDAWKRCFEVNVFGVFNTIRAALPAIMKQGGYVLINASSCIASRLCEIARHHARSFEQRNIARRNSSRHCARHASA